MLQSIDVLALRLAGKLTNDEIGDLVRRYSSLEDALLSVGHLAFDVQERAQAQLERCAQLDVTIITIVDDAYPVRMRTIANAPAVLWVAGCLPPNDRFGIAVVGTRQCTHQYGRPVTELLVQAWMMKGAAIVSGLANGIDTIAHETTLRHNGCTVAVIASGIDRITPLPAKHLASQIAATGGAVVSEHPCGIAALPPYFPARNRIIAGLSDAVVVVESKRRGGALITADFALQQGKPLYAVPGPITSKRSEGCNALCASGKARVLCGPEDVAEMPPTPHALFVGVQLPAGLDDGLPHDADELCALWKCDSATGLARLLDLELQGAIRQLPGNRYVGHIAGNSRC